MSNLIVVIGVTGIQGSSVANTFLRLPGWKVRGIARNPSGTAAQAHAANGVEIVQGDLDDKSSLISAFEGATAIYSNTNFFCHLFEVIGSNHATTGRSPNKYAFDREAEQGINVVEAAAVPAVLKTLRHFIYSSLSDASKWSGGKYTHVYHNDTKAEVIRVVHDRFPELAARMSTLQMGFYVRNWHVLRALAPQKQPDGSFVLESVFSPEYVNPFVVPHEDTGAFVKALVDLPSGKSLLGVSQAMTWPEYAKLWGDVIGVNATYKHVSKGYILEHAPEALKEELEDGWNYCEEFGHTGGDPDVLSAEQLGVNIPVTSMKEYIESEDWSSVLS